MILEKIRDIDKFTDSEQTIIQYLLSHSEDILMLSVRDLAKVSFTSSSTVNRLAGKLSDHKGFTQFKAELFAELHSNSLIGPTAGMSVPLSGSGADSPYDITATADRIATLQSETIEFTRRNLDLDDLAKAIDILKSPGALYFFGFDNNVNLARIYLNRMLSFGKSVVIHDAVNAQFYQALTIPEDGCALVISRTGTNKRLIEIMQILHEKGTKIISLTPIKGSQIGMLSNICLQVRSDSPFDAVGNVVFETSLNYIMNLLCSIMFSDNSDNSRNVLREYNMLYAKNEGGVFLK